MGTGAASEAEAVERLAELMAASRRWRAENPELVPRVPPGVAASAAKRRAAARRCAELDAAALAYAVDMGVPLTPECPEPEGRHVVEGDLRERLLDWLAVINDGRAVDGELTALGDVTSVGPDRPVALQPVLDLLAGEGFGHVRDARLDEEHRLQVWLDPVFGLLAEVNEYRGTGGAWEAETARVHGCVEVVDRELLACGAGADRVVDGGRATSFAVVDVGLWLRRPRNSLRVNLAVLRAAARPALRWPYPGIRNWLGPDALTAGLAASHEESVALSEAASDTVLSGLPWPVLDLLGPHVLRSREKRTP